MHIFTSLPLHRTNSLFLFFFAAAPLIFFLHLSPPSARLLSSSWGAGDEGRSLTSIRHHSPPASRSRHIGRERQIRRRRSLLALHRRSRRFSLPLSSLRLPASARWQPDPPAVLSSLPRRPDPPHRRLARWSILVSSAGSAEALWPARCGGGHPGGGGGQDDGGRPQWRRGHRCSPLARQMALELLKSLSPSSPALVHHHRPPQQTMRQILVRECED